MSARRGGSEEARIDATAAEWLVRRANGLSAAEQRELEAWRLADPRHAVALDRAQAAWGVFDRAEQRGVTSAIITQLQVRARQRRSRRRKVAAGAAAVVALAVFFGFATTSRETAGLAAVAPAAEPLRKLPDGSMMELNAGAAAQVRFEPAVRRVVLERGEAHFTVAKDAARPFIVQAGPVRVKALGTAFTVDLRAGAVEVVVTEGRVTMDRRATANPAEPGTLAEVPPVLEAGRRVLVSLEAEGRTPEVSMLSDAELTTRLAWRRHRVDFTHATLVEAAAVLNRHNQLQIVVVGEEVARLRVSGSFGAENPEGFARIVEATFGLRAERRSEHEIVLRSAP